MEQQILIHPRFFGPDLVKEAKRQLFKEVEGKCNGNYGFVIAITEINSLKAGVIPPGQGTIPFKAKFKAVIFRPFKGEVLDAVVTQVNQVFFRIYFCYNLDD